MARRRASSSVSLSLSPSPSVERVSRRASPKRSPVRNGPSDKIPLLGTVVDGVVKSSCAFGYFISVPGHLDGLVHITRKVGRLSHGDRVYAKVVLVGKTKYGLDMRFVNQKTGKDEDPKNVERIKLEPAIATGKFPEDSAIPAKVKKNKVYGARVFKAHDIGYFVSLDGLDSRGLLPAFKATGKLREGEKIYVKVVEVIRNDKYNCDMRYVDQTNGKDLDPDHIHSDEKGNTGRGRDRSRSRSWSRSNARRRRDYSDSPIRRRRWDDSDSPIRRRRDRSESVIRRRK